MKTYTYFIGIDVSKDVLDLTIRSAQEVLDHQVIDNQAKSIQKYFKEQGKTRKDLTAENTLICLENTGRYMNVLFRTLVLENRPIWVENALTIKRSMGLQRGKNDKTDAGRIAEYAFRYADKAVLYVPAKESLQKLKALESLRSQLVNTRKRFNTELKESQICDVKFIFQLKEKGYKRTLKAIEKDIQDVDNQLNEVINKDEELKRLSAILLSVPGIGQVTSTALLIVSRGFTRFDSAKKLACYCGVAPFEHTSGKSIRGKTRTSNFANKAIKSLLHMCARSVIRVKGELRDFYERKIAEGKEKMVALNAVQNKLIHRIVALVRDDRFYENNYRHELA